MAGNPDALREWFNNGADGKIDWGEPGSFASCVDLASEHMDEDQAKGFCAERHHDATGHWPGEKKADLAARVAALELAVTTLARTEFGDVEGHPFRGNQHTGGHGGDESGPKDGGKGPNYTDLVSQIGSNVNGREHGAILKAALAGPVPALADNGGKNLALRLAAELHAAGLPRNSGYNGGEITGWTKSQGSTGFSIGPAYGMNADRSKVIERDGLQSVHMVISGEAAGLRYSNREEINSVGDTIELHEPNDPASVRDKIERVLSDKLGMEVVEVRQTGHQMHWDDDVDYTATVKAVGEPPAEPRQRRW